MFLFKYENHYYIFDLWGNGYFKSKTPQECIQKIVENRFKFEDLTIQDIQKDLKITLL